jgi:hypothetical protein
MAEFVAEAIGQLASSRTQELQSELLAAGIPL